MASRLPGVMFHNLKGIRGWSICEERNLDVSLIKFISYRKRLFMLFDTKYPYTITVDYKLPRQRITFNPVITANHQGYSGGVSMSERTELSQLITTRLESEQECVDELIAISHKQKALDLLALKLQKKAEKCFKTHIEMPAFLDGKGS
jgi:hypothetical protein